MNKKTIWIVVALIGSYILCQAVADIGATKLISITGITMPAGSLIFALTFTIRDLIHKRLGKTWSQAAIVCAGAFNIVQALYLAWMARLPWPPFYQLGEAWSAVFAVVPAITVGSIAAEIISELIDTEVYHFYRQRFSNAPQWTRVLTSNAISLPIDSLVFASLAFVVLPPLFGAESIPFATALSLVGGQIVYKGIITLVSMPGIYLVREDKPILAPSSL